MPKILMLAIATAFSLAAGTTYRACQPEPVTPAPVAVGGAQSFGGATSAGGAPSPVGGASNSGGKSATTTAEPTLPAMQCPPVKRAAPVKRALKWRPSVARRAPAARSFVVIPSAVTREWPLRVMPNLDQGNEGACTGFGVAQCVSSGDFRNRLTAADGRRIYYRATEIDSFPGTAPKTDTGSDGKSALRAAVEFGFVDGYYSPATFEEVQEALQRGPCVFGSNWYTGMFSPDASCQMHLTGIVEGGHLYEINRLDVQRRLVGIENSWGPEFGSEGKATLSYSDFFTLMNQAGEVDCPNPPNASRVAVRVPSLSP